MSRYISTVLTILFLFYLTESAAIQRKDTGETENNNSVTESEKEEGLHSEKKKWIIVTVIGSVCISLLGVLLCVRGEGDNEELMSDEARENCRCCLEVTAIIFEIIAIFK